MGIRIAPIKNPRRVWISMQVSPRRVATARIISPMMPVKNVVIIIKKIKIGIEIFV